MKNRVCIGLLGVLFLSGCGADSDFGNLTCRNKMYADPGVQAAIAKSVSPDTDPAVHAAKAVVYDDCTSKLMLQMDRGNNVRFRN